MTTFPDIVPVRDAQGEPPAVRSSQRLELPLLDDNKGIKPYLKNHKLAASDSKLPKLAVAESKPPKPTTVAFGRTRSLIIAKTRGKDVRTFHRGGNVIHRPRQGTNASVRETTEDARPPSPRQRGPQQGALDRRPSKKARPFKHVGEAFGPWPDMSSIELHKEVSNGRSGVVYAAMDKFSKECLAIKSYNKNGDVLDLAQMKREIGTTVKLSHPNVQKVLGMIEDDTHYHVISDWLPGGDLLVLLDERKQLPEAETLEKYVLPTLKALQHVHRNNIIHRDVKAENILLNSSGTAVVADFGLAIDTRKEQPCMQVGTIDYMCPEVLALPNVPRPSGWGGLELGGHALYDTKVDVWAVGILVYELLTGITPFEGTSHSKTKAAILTKDFTSCLPLLHQHDVSDECCGFISSCLQKDPKERPTVDELLRTEWVRSAPAAVLEGLEEHLAAPAGPPPASASSPDPADRPSPSPSRSRSALLDDGLYTREPFADVTAAASNAASGAASDAAPTEQGKGKKVAGLRLDMVGLPARLAGISSTRSTRQIPHELDLAPIASARTNEPSPTEDIVREPEVLSGWSVFPPTVKSARPSKTPKPPKTKKPTRNTKAGFTRWAKDVISAQKSKQ